MKSWILLFFLGEEMDIKHLWFKPKEKYLSGYEILYLIELD